MQTSTKRMKSTLTILSVFLVGISQAQVINPSPYCNGAFDDAGGFNVSDAIKSVSIGSLTNNSAGQFGGGHYVYYNNLAAPVLNSGTTIPMNIIFEVHGGAGYGVWIDFNHNNTFEANEKVAGSTANGWLDMNNNTTINATVSIPATALPGETRMRVRIVEDDEYTMTNGAAILPCNASTSATDIMDWGETEDYKVNITGGTNNSKPQAAFTASAVNGTVNNSIITLTDNSTNTPTAWNWTFTPNSIAYQGSSSAISSNPSLKFTAAGTYTVKLLVSNAAGKDSIVKTNYITIASGPTAIEELSLSNGFNFYPNPSDGTFYVDRVYKGATLRITDINGKVCFKQDKFSGNKLEVSQLKGGTYFIKVVEDDKTFYQKIFIMK
jgi:hypothetical protein